MMGEPREYPLVCEGCGRNLPCRHCTDPDAGGGSAAEHPTQAGEMTELEVRFRRNPEAVREARRAARSSEAFKLPLA